jgi:large subunit ribosomal protein L22
MNTAARDRALLHTVEDYFKRGQKATRTPIAKLALSRDKSGKVNVLLHTSRPNIVRMETTALAQDLKDRIGSVDGAALDLTVQVVPEARAIAKWVRASPRKVRLIADVIKGKGVTEAMAMLRFIPNHAAADVSKVLKSAAANAQDGWGAGYEDLKVANVVADGGRPLKRVRARAQGRAYHILKRTSHITVVLIEAPVPVRPARPAAVPAKNRATAAAPAKATAKPAAPKAASKAPAAIEAVEPIPGVTAAVPDIAAAAAPEIAEHAQEPPTIESSSASAEETTGPGDAAPKAEAE